MSPDEQGAAAINTVSVQLSAPEWQLRTAISVPSAPTELKQLLPVIQTFADALIGSVANSVEQSGQKISCRKGCGACCRQLVSISETEAWRIRELVRNFPEPRRSEIGARFAEARRRIEDSGLLDKLLKPEDWTEDDGGSLGMKYFHLGIPCPFLKDEACSIHNDRPLVCREYLVTSPPENCAKPSTERIEQVALPFKIWTAVARFDKVAPAARYLRWVPLALLLDWADAHTETVNRQPGPDLLRRLFDYLCGRSGAQATNPFDQNSQPTEKT